MSMGYRAWGSRINYNVWKVGKIKNRYFITNDLLVNLMKSVMVCIQHHGAHSCFVIHFISPLLFLHVASFSFIYSQ